ncbi:MAG TPA: GNAT family N-acetyltransferase [Ktedonobacteraceae bacterium]|nr:GNAT family N-acetyltransferase [Ktedonobacteraceae bacterium]
MASFAYRGCLGVRLPAITQNTIELLREGVQPPWKLYVAEMAGEQVAIWRPDVPASEREALLAPAGEALAIPQTGHVAPHIHREVVLQQVASPAISIEAAQHIARLLTPGDRTLVDIFAPGEVEYYFHPDRRPLVGVIVEGRLLSLAHSSRRTVRACELGIDTLPEARRKGYALAATLLWATAVTQEGLVAFYSASVENVPSLALAAAAGYRVFAQAVMIE